jgi:hypothetical protein
MHGYADASYRGSRGLRQLDTFLLRFLNHIHSLPGYRDPNFIGPSYLNLPALEEPSETRIPTKAEVKALHDALLCMAPKLRKKWSKKV